MLAAKSVVFTAVNGSVRRHAIFSNLLRTQTIDRGHALTARSSLKRFTEAYTSTSSSGNGVTPHTGKPVLEPAHWDGFVAVPSSQFQREPAQGLQPNRLRLFSGTSNPVRIASNVRLEPAKVQCAKAVCKMC